MGLKMQKELNSGVTVEYWRITSGSFRLDIGLTEILLDGYITKEARDNQKNPVMEAQRRIPLRVEKLKSGKGNWLGMMYKAITDQEEEFKEATQA